MAGIAVTIVPTDPLTFYLNYISIYDGGYDGVDDDDDGDNDDDDDDDDDDGDYDDDGGDGGDCGGDEGGGDDDDDEDYDDGVSFTEYYILSVICTVLNIIIVKEGWVCSDNNTKEVYVWRNGIKEELFVRPNAWFHHIENFYLGIFGHTLLNKITST